MPQTEIQLNESVQGNLRIPYSFYKTPLYEDCGRKLRRSEIKICGAVYTFSDPKKEQRCNMTLSRFEEKLNLSRGTVARGIKALKEAKRITQDKSRRSCASYKVVDRPQERGYISIELYLYRTKFIIKGEAEPQYLTDSEIDVLSLIKTHCGNEKGNGKFVGSVRGIARTLNLSKTAVQTSIERLIRAGLIYRTKEGTGKNGYKRSEYTVNEKLLRRMKRKEERAEKAAETEEKQTKYDRRTEAERAADARAEYEKHYAERQRKANERVEWFTERLNGDNTYQIAERRIRALDIEIARAEAYGSGNLAKLKEEQTRRKAERARRMAELNITEKDLIPKWQCTKCKDTGYKKDGRMCDCYPKRWRKQ